MNIEVAKYTHCVLRKMTLVVGLHTATVLGGLVCYFCRSKTSPCCEDNGPQGH
jgi:hypothetical protein